MVAGANTKPVISKPVIQGKKRIYTSLAAIAFLAAVALLVYMNGTTTPPASGKMADDKLAVLEVRLQNLENSTALYADRLTKLERDVAANARNAASDISANNAAAMAVRDHPAAADPAPASPEEARRIEMLEKELATLKAAAPMQSGEHINHAIKLLSSFHRLSDKVMSGKPYAEELSAFENELGDTAAENKPLNELATYSENGVPTQAELLATFDNAVDQLGAAQAVPPADAGAWDRFIFNLTHLIRIRRIDAAQMGKDSESVIARASSHLDKDEIEAAFAEINALAEPDKKAFSEWLKDAQIAIDTPGLTDQLEEQVMQQAFSAPPAPAETAPAPAADKGLVVQ